ncbi:MAG: hypothetical protein J0H96_11765 [Microbacterium ginsengisoli]|jgi:hypothetical protein|nr:hypothetical protein [Microbacterium ginsengisoli]
MSIHHIEQAAELELHATTKLVLMSIADDASKETRISHPGMAKMLVWSGAGERRIQQIIDDLIARGLLARTAFAHPGRRAEFLVFPTSSEYVELDAKDVRLNAGHPVDNSPEMGEVGFGAAQNGCNPEPNGRNPGFTPPVSTPGLDIDHVTEETTDAPVDNSAAGGRDGQAPPQPNPKNLSALRGHGFSPADAFASIGHILAPTRIDDEGLTLLGREIVAVSPTRVLNPTAYVVTQIRDTRSRSEWVSRAWVIAANVAMSRLENGGNA